MILDTGSSVNVIQEAVAKELALAIVGQQPAGSSAGGVLLSAPIYLLGDIQFDHLPSEERFTVMSGLQAASLNVPSPGSAGILGRPFLDSFPVVEFAFSEASDEIRLYASEDDIPLMAGKSRIPMSTLGISGLWGVELSVTSLEKIVTLKALVDTGAPTTILNLAAAEALGLDAAAPPPPPPQEDGKGLLGGLMSKIAKQVPRASGLPGLRVSPTPLSLSIHLPLKQDSEDVTISLDSSIDLGSWRPLMGDLPGFTVLGVEKGEAAAILGLDALRSTGFLTFFPQSKEMLM